MFVIQPLSGKNFDARFDAMVMGALLAFPPLVVYLWVPWVIDRYDPEPWWCLALALLWGGVAAAGFSGAHQHRGGGLRAVDGGRGKAGRSLRRHHRSVHQRAAGRGVLEGAGRLRDFRLLAARVRRRRRRHHLRHVRRRSVSPRPKMSCTTRAPISCRRSGTRKVRSRPHSSCAACSRPGATRSTRR